MFLGAISGADALTAPAGLMLVFGLVIAQPPGTPRRRPNIAPRPRRRNLPARSYRARRNFGSK